MLLVAAAAAVYLDVEEVVLHSVDPVLELGPLVEGRRRQLVVLDDVLVLDVDRGQQLENRAEAALVKDQRWRSRAAAALQTGREGESVSSNMKHASHSALVLPR